MRQYRLFCKNRLFVIEFAPSLLRDTLRPQNYVLHFITILFILFDYIWNSFHVSIKFETIVNERERTICVRTTYVFVGWTFEDWLIIVKHLQTCRRPLVLKYS